MKQCFQIIGISDSRKQFFAPEVREVIAAGHIFSGGKRHHEIVADLLPEGAVWIDITVPLEEVFQKYEEVFQNDEELVHSVSAKGTTIVVFASGDPLFYGFANTVMQRLPEAEVKVFPSFNSLQLLAHRRSLPYQQMRVVSLTGRDWLELDRAVIEGEALIGVLTDRKKTPAEVALRLLQYGYDNYRMTVGELLGNEEQEQVSMFTLTQASVRSYRCPNCLLLERTKVRQRLFGIPEGAFDLLNGRAKMITKRPIRLMSLSMLDLHQRSSLWDIGFCTGSVSIEAKLQFPHLRVTAFERREEGRVLMEQNSKRFGTPGIEAIIGDFMELPLEGLPRPDAVFIGGHGGQLKEMLHCIEKVLQPGGVIVFNSVSEESLQMFEEGIREIGRTIVERTRMQVDEFNAIEIVKAE
jgi:precorrin-6Y C5,15-methyltransferase (decarboxylating)